MSSRIKHIFYNPFSFERIPLTEDHNLLINDYCEHCGLKITGESFNNYIVGSYQGDQEFINEKFPCLTEEEFLIKQLLE